MAAGDDGHRRRHADVRELLSRDLDFLIAPVNAGRIEEVNGPFVLGMDRGARLATERQALYGALAAVDVAPLRQAAAEEAEARLRDVTSIDIVGDYARPIAAHTAQRLFGITGTDQQTFEDVARAIFAHTFLNLGNDKVVRDRAVRAAGLMRAWLADEIDRRTANGKIGQRGDMMDGLLAAGTLDADGVRRTLGGMLVGSVDTPPAPSPRSSSCSPATRSCLRRSPSMSTIRSGCAAGASMCCGAGRTTRSCSARPRARRISPHRSACR